LFFSVGFVISLRAFPFATIILQGLSFRFKGLHSRNCLCLKWRLYTVCLCWISTCAFPPPPPPRPLIFFGSLHAPSAIRRSHPAGMGCPLEIPPPPWQCPTVFPTLCVPTYFSKCFFLSVSSECQTCFPITVRYPSQYLISSFSSFVFESRDLMSG